METSRGMKKEKPRNCNGALMKSIYVINVNQFQDALLVPQKWSN